MSIDVTNASEYTEVLSQLNLWYGRDASKIVDIINEYGLTPEQVTEDYLSGSGFEPWYTSSGSVGGYNVSGTFAGNASAGSAAAELNSNIGSTSQVGVKTAVETGYDQAGKLTVSKGLTSVATGAKSALTFTFKEVLPAVSAAGVGIALGKKIDSALYNANPDFWDNAGLSSLNPETWNSITSDYPDGFLKKAFNTVFGLNPDTGETQMYLDEDAVAYLAQYMQEQGVFATGEKTVQSDEITIPDINQPVNMGGAFLAYQSGYETYAQYTVQPLINSAAFVRGDSGTVTGITLICAAKTQQTDAFTYTIRNYIDGTVVGTYTQITQPSYTYNGKTAYYSTFGFTPSDGKKIIYDSGNKYNFNVSTNQIGMIAWLLVYGTITDTQPIEGISTQDGSTTPDFGGCTTLQDFKNALQNQFHDLYDKAVTQNVANPDGTTKTKKFLPIGTPSKNNKGNKTQPVTNTDNSGNTQNNSKANPTNLDLTGLNNLIKTLTDTISKTGQPKDIDNPEPTGSGTTPPVAAPTGQASALFAVYNPSQAQLNSFGAWLWSSNFIDQVLKLFNNPMQAIIGLHKIFVTPPISGAGNIRVGYLDSGVGANLVGEQYTTVDCGSVKVSEEFGNVFDYTDTHIRLYLPFIGIVDLDTADVMRGTVSVKYHVDVITGACLADVEVSRDGAGGTLYQYSGDASVRYPISSGSYMGVVSGVLSAVGGVASAVMTGGATLPMAAGAIAGGLSGAHTQVQHSGNFSGNAGAMGAKTPYLIIERPQTAIAEDFGGYQGKGANSVRTVSEMSGYFKFSDVHTDSISGAAQSEIEAIRAALESGVIK